MCKLPTAVAIHYPSLLGTVVLQALHSGAFTPAMLDTQLKSAHMHHHYVDEATGFGISSRLYDLVFGTLPSKQHTL